MEENFKHIDVPFETKGKSTEDDDFFYIKGYASTRDKDLVNDVVMEDAFADSIKEWSEGRHKIKVLFGHDKNLPIGRLDLIREDEKGLYVEFVLPKEDEFVRTRIIPQVKIGSIDSMSIGYSVQDEEFRDGVNHLKKVTLHEFSLVVFPANPRANITDFKSLTIDNLKEIDAKKLEQCLKEGTVFSQSAAKKLVSLAKDGLQCEVESKQREAVVEEKLAKIMSKDLDDRINKIKKWRK